MSKKLATGKILSAVLSFYSVIGAVLFIFFKKLVPFPLAEIVSFIYMFFINGKKIVAVTAFVFYAVTVVLTLSLLFKKIAVKIYFYLPAAIVFFFDGVLHLYAFLFSSGYEWNYFISAVLDFAVIFSILKKENV